MVRGKIQMKKIENAATRQVTFSKRQKGLLKKAYELSVLCDAEVAVIVFSQKNRIYEFSSSNILKTIERYHKHEKEGQSSRTDMEKYTQHETKSLANSIELLEVSQRGLLGQGLSSCTIEELQAIEEQLEQSLSNIKSRKTQIFKEQIDQLKAKEKLLLEENARLCEQNLLQQQSTKQQKEDATKCIRGNKFSEVDTELFIGLPKMHCSYLINS